MKYSYSPPLSLSPSLSPSLFPSPSPSSLSLSLFLSPFLLTIHSDSVVLIVDLQRSQSHFYSPPLLWWGHPTGLRHELLTTMVDVYPAVRTLYPLTHQAIEQTATVIAECGAVVSGCFEFMRTRFLWVWACVHERERGGERGRGWGGGYTAMYTIPN